MKRKFNFEKLPKEFIGGAKELVSTLELAQSDDGLIVVAEKSDKETGFEIKGNTAFIRYVKKAHFYRMLSLIETVDSDKYVEIPRHENLCYMADQSRNAVFNMESAKRMARYLACLGYNELQLYTEETYEIEGEPYFGHLRGRWTKNQLREFDDYCDMLGIELVPCIQTLAHLERMFVWNRYSDINDKGTVLLVGADETYELIEKMFKTCSECIRSKKINIGLDEAHDLGLGKYLEKNGFERRFDIMTKHLKKVLEISRKYGYKPMMWSDMYFRLSFGGAYYDETKSVPRDVVESVPEDVTLVYWDYYTIKDSLFDNMVRGHKAFKNNIAFAGGVQKWGDFVSVSKLTFDIEGMHIDKCIENGIKDIITTGWGDNGAEAAHFSILPGLTFYAEKCFIGDVDKNWIDTRFENLAKISMVPFELMNDMNYPHKSSDEIRKHQHYSKVMLYSDILVDMYSKHIIRDKFYNHYKEIAEKLAQYKDNKNFGYIVDMAQKLAVVDMYKSILPVDIRQAYEKGDKKTLCDIAGNLIPKTVNAVDELLSSFEKMWKYESRNFGLETHQIRLGGLKQRLLCCADIIMEYVDGKVDRIEELEQPLLYKDNRQEGTDAELYPRTDCRWAAIVTPCIM